MKAKNVSVVDAADDDDATALSAAASGLDLLLHACAREGDGFEIQTIDELKRGTSSAGAGTTRMGRKNKNTMTTMATSSLKINAAKMKKSSALRKPTLNDGKRSETRGGDRRVTERLSNATTPTPTKREPVLEGAELLYAAEELALTHPGVIIERARQWLELVIGDVRARLAALKRSRRRTQRAWMAFSETPEARMRSENENGVNLLNDFDRTLSVEQKVLEKNLEDWLALHERAGYEASRLKLGWLNACAATQETPNKHDRSIDWQAEYSQSAFAFLRMAVGAYIGGTQTPTKQLSPDDFMKTPNNVLDASQVFSPLT